MTATAAAPTLESLPTPEIVPGRDTLPGRDQSAAPESDVRERASYQPSLFRDGSGAPKVIPIPTLTPTHSPMREIRSTRRVQTRTTARPRRVADSQQELEFQEAEAASDSRACDAPVARPGYRLLAASVDASMILIGLGVFTVMLILALGDTLVINRQTAPFLIAVGAVIALFYRSLWYFGNVDTPGMRFAGLRLVDFDGHPPDREQRGMRQVAGLLSLLAAGLGLVWALVDEESLTWHDHMSKTFPTPGRPE
jgi:uncharacterized RDD family membrane protein YckC